MKNKQGFTLIEVLSIIIVLGILISIAIPNISKVVKYGKDKSYDLLVTTIEDSAKLHVSQDRRVVQDVIKDIGVHEITLAELIESGKLKEGIIDPRTNEVIPTTKRVLVMYNEDMALLYCYEDNNCPEPYTRSNWVPPVITLLGDNPVTIYQGETYVDAGATAVDDIDGDITDEIVVTSNVDVETLGEYTVTYNVSDSSGNEAIEIVRTVIVKLWTCGDVLIDERDTKEYATVQIETQCWMAENLRYTGEEETGCLSKTWNSSTKNACLKNGGSGWDKDEVLYQWEAAMEACPPGWHLPTHDEWTTLERAVCTSGTCETDFPKNTTTTDYRGTDEGYKLKSITNWNSGGIGDNSSGFNALPAGRRDTSSTLNSVGLRGIWWSSSSDGTDAWRRGLNYEYSAVYRITNSQAYGYSVRCLAGT